MCIYIYEKQIYFHSQKLPLIRKQHPTWNPFPVSLSSISSGIENFLFFFSLGLFLLLYPQDIKHTELQQVISFVSRAGHLLFCSPVFLEGYKTYSINYTQIYSSPQQVLVSPFSLSSSTDLHLLLYTFPREGVSLSAH